MKYLVASLAAGLVLLAGCPDRSVSPVEVVPEAAFIKNIPVSVNLDILFVIDNSASTRDKQTVFASNYPRFVEALDRFPSGRPNLHIGVVTSSVDIGVDGFGPQCHPATGQNGALQNASRDRLFTCAPPTADRFLSDVANPDGSRKVNYSGRLDEALSCISHAGDSGCGFEAPLEAMKRALDGSRPENAGFLRRGAFLAVVFLTDEDDCSARQSLFEQPAETVGKDDIRCALAAYRCDHALSSSAPGTYTGCRVRRDGFMTVPSDYAQFLLTLDGPSGVAAALIAGEPTDKLTTGTLTLTADDGRTFVQDLAVEPTCSATINGNPAVGRPPLRLDEMLGVLGDRGLFRTICQADFSGALGDIGALLFKATSPCLEGTLDVRDTAPGNPGVQPDCTVSDLERPDTDPEIETLIPPCPMLAADRPDLAGARACWWVAPSTACLTETQLELRIERSAPAAPETTVRVSCALAEP
jgi:hypothetical protein